MVASDWFKLLPAAFLLGAAPPPAAPAAGKSLMVFVVAEDKGAESSTEKIATLITEAIGRNPGFELVDLRDAAGDAVPPEVRSIRKSADADLEAGKKAFDEGTLDVADQKLRSAIKGYENCAPALENIDSYVDAHAYLAASYQLRGKEEDAKDEIIDLLAIRSSYKPAGKLAGGAFADLVKTARKESGDTHHGAAILNTVPPGGKIYVDGELKGYAPLSLEHLPVGNHVFVFERPGYYNGGQVGEITSTDDLVIKGHFNPTKDYGDVEEAVSAAGKEIQSASAGPNAWRVLSHFKVDRAIIGNLRTSGDNLVIDLGMLDAKSHTRLAKRRNAFEGEEYGALSQEVNRLVNGLVADAEDGGKTAKNKKHSRDPLDDVSGEEGWDDEKGEKGNDSMGSSSSSSDDDSKSHHKSKPASDD